MGKKYINIMGKINLGIYHRRGIISGNLLWEQLSKQYFFVGNSKDNIDTDINPIFITGVCLNSA